MNFSESRQNRSRENREKSKNRFFPPPLLIIIRFPPHHENPRPHDTLYTGVKQTESSTIQTTQETKYVLLGNYN